jgi:glycosyltransferase involved in cell wall biosynthesis
VLAGFLVAVRAPAWTTGYSRDFTSSCANALEMHCSGKRAAMRRLSATCIRKKPWRVIYLTQCQKPAHRLSVVVATLRGARKSVAATSLWRDLYRRHWQGLYLEHPIRPEARDPLELFEPAGGQVEASLKSDTKQLRLGYAALWELVPQGTLSGVAWNLRKGIGSITDTVDIGVETPFLTRMAFKAAYTRYRGGRFTTSWCYSTVYDAYIGNSLRRGRKSATAEGGLDAILMVDALAATPEPFFVYYDSSWDALIASAESPARYANLRGLTKANMFACRDRQLAIYAQATGVIVYSRWLARCLTEQSGVSPEKIHVIPPAAVARRQQPNGDGGRSVRAQRSGARRSLLCIGRTYDIRDFYRKGIDLVIDAVGVLRREYDSQITLTLAGMKDWPLPGGPPDGVNFRGVLPSSEVAELYDTHDVFVMPSRMEPFGLVFAEALAKGIPVVARNAYAMPEMVTPGISGALIERDDPYELAAAIAGVLGDDEIHKQCAERAPQMASYFSWERAAREMIGLIAKTIS